MATLIQGKWLSSGAKQTVLESKLVALRNVVTNFEANGGDDVVTTGVLAASATDTPQTDLSALGIYTGAVTGATDPLKVLIRAYGTDNGIDDGTGDEIYGVLTEATGVYTLTYKKADGTAFSFGTATPIDFYFIEIYNEYSKPTNAHLLTAIGGVIDATSANALSNHINAATDAHDASAISVLDTGNLFTATDVEAALAEVMGAANDAQADATAALNAIGTLDATPDNYTPATNDVGAHLVAIDGMLGKIVEPVTQILTLDSTDIGTNKYKNLSSAILADSFNTVSVVPVGGPEQEYTVDFTAANDGPAGVGRVTWSGLGLEAVLEAGDKIIVRYTKKAD